MIGQARLDQIVSDGLGDGKNADQIAKRTGVPIERVQATMYRLTGTDPAQAKRHTRKNRRTKNRRLYGT